MRLQSSHTLPATALKLKLRMQFTMDSSILHVAIAEMMLIRLENSVGRIAAYNH
jgi:hypothetical protein